MWAIKGKSGRRRQHISIGKINESKKHAEQKQTNNCHLSVPHFFPFDPKLFSQIPLSLCGKEDNLPYDRSATRKKSLKSGTGQGGDMWIVIRPLKNYTKNQ